MLARFASGESSTGGWPKPNGLVVDLGDGRMLMASAPFKGSFVTIGVTGGLRISNPAEKAEEVAEAILYAHRCVFEHEHETRSHIAPAAESGEERSAGAAPA